MANDIKPLTAYRCAQPGCTRLCVGWLCRLHEGAAQTGK